MYYTTMYFLQGKFQTIVTDATEKPFGDKQDTYHDVHIP
jgi:hypothetical protein